MNTDTTRSGPVQRMTLRARLAALYGAVLLGVVIVVLTAALVFARTATAPAGVERTVHAAHAIEFGAGSVILVAVLAGLWLAWRLAGLYLRPLRVLSETARDIASTDLNRRLELRGPDEEVNQIGGTFDDLFGRLESSFESQRRFIAHAAHELRTPLAGQRTVIQVALADPNATLDSLRSSCEEVLALGERQGQLLDGLLTLATSERGVERREEIDLGEISRRVVASRHDEAQRRSIEVRSVLEVAPALGDPVLVESLIANLLDNALQHNAAMGGVDITTQRLREGAQFSISNTGPVVPTADVDRLFEPFQRLGPGRIGSAAGHGLGLAIVKAIAEAHGATITSHARNTGGLGIQIRFPAP